MESQEISLIFQGDLYLNIQMKILILNLIEPSNGVMLPQLEQHAHALFS
jgi:hypothetical protein